MQNRFFGAVAAAALAITASLASAADWAPPGPIKLMIAFAAGGGADTRARLIAEELESAMGWEFIPEQVTGKGGLNLAAAMKDMPADGSTIGIVVTETLGYNMRAANAGLTPDMFTPIATTAGFQMGIVAPAEKGWSTFADVVVAAKSGEALRFGTMSAKLSDLAFLPGEAQGAEFNILQLRGGRAVMDGVNAGDMDLGFMAGIQRKGVASGDLVNLASTLSTPLVQTPEAPILADFGVEFVANGYFLFMAPAGLPDDARSALANAIGGSVSDKNTKDGGPVKAAFGGASVITGAELDALIARDDEAASALLAATE